MNLTDELLMLMQDGTPYTVEEIMDATGMSKKRVINTIYRLTMADLVTARPLCYRVTPSAKDVIAGLRSGDAP